MLDNNKLVPINDWIMVEETEPEKVSAGGIIIPVESRKKGLVKECKVIAISKDIDRIIKEEGGRLCYKVGNLVLHHSQTGIKVNATDKDDHRYFLKYDAVMALVEKKEKFPVLRSLTEEDLKKARN